jgi:DNA-binding NtrC family response regulator
MLVTDMVMPGGVMGSELAQILLKQSPGLKVIYTSGYSPGMAGKDATLMERRNFLPKPYSIGKLAQFVRECLDSTGKPEEVQRKLEAGMENIAPTPANAEISAWQAKSETAHRNGIETVSEEQDTDGLLAVPARA